MPSPASLPPPPMDSELAGDDGRISPPWTRWIQLLSDTTRGLSTSALPLVQGDSSATPGNATLDTPSGFSAIAAGASSVTITNAMVAADSIIDAIVHQALADATLTHVVRVDAIEGFLTIYGNANATAAVRVQWFVVGAI